MKVKNKELKKFSDEELLAEIIFRSKSKKGLPTKAKCFKCRGDFWIKWNNTTQSPSKLHNWKYWSGRNEDKNIFICSPCLKITYSDLEKRKEFLSKIKEPKMLKNLTSYIARNVI